MVLRPTTSAAVALMLIFAFCLLSCQTKPPSDEEPHVAIAPLSEFEPGDFVSPIHHQEGQYQGLFSPSSTAIWVGPDISALKKQKDEKAGKSIDPKLEEEAETISASFIVIECALESAFSDMSIAHDVVGLRGIDVYMLMPDGKKIYSIQKVMKSPLEEEQQGALKLFRRTNLIIFPKRDFLLGNPTVGAGATSAKLVLEGYSTKNYFEWVGAAGATWQPEEKTAARAIKVGFSEFYGMLRPLVHAFD